MTPNDVNIVADNIGDFIEVPDGVGRLRKAVFVLAASGKLVPQDLKEGNTEELYHQIQSEWNKIDKDAKGNDKKKKDSLSVTCEDILIKIPESWKYVHIHEVVELVTKGTTPKTYGHPFTTEGVPFLRAEDVQNREINVRAITHHISSETNNFLSRSKTKHGDVLLTIAGTIGKATVGRKEMPEMNMNQAVAIIRLKRFVYSDFVALLFRSENIQAQIRAGTVKMAIPNFSLTMIKNLLIPLPPLAEQKRIVKKVEELMKQLDELEVKKRERDETRTRLARSAMQSLGKGKSKIAFEQLAELIKTPADIKELEGALLALAVSGKLVPQDKKEGTAEELYTQIQVEREKLRKSANGQRKKAKELASIVEKEIPFEIPKSWKWVRMGSVTNYGATDKFKPGDIKEGMWILELEDLKKNGGKLVSLVRYPDRKSLSDKNVFNAGDVLYGKLRPYLNKVIVATEDGLASSELLPIRWVSALGDARYLRLVMLSHYFSAYVNQITYGVKMPRLGTDDGRAALIPLPPLAEQKRIVKKVEEVMDLINHLKQLIGEK